MLTGTTGFFCAGMVAMFVSGWIERQFFYPDSAHYTTPAQFGLPAEDVWLQAPDGSKLHAWFLPARGAPKATVLHLHGNAANIGNHLPLVAWLPAAGYQVLLLDYRGFGRSQGRPSLDGVVVLLNSDEEIGSPTSRALIEEQARQVDAVLVLG